jgi:PAS domain S-box-containing protein
MEDARIRLYNMFRMNSPFKYVSEWCSVFRLPALCSLLTVVLIAVIAILDLWFTPSLHVGVFLYPVSILTALWWGGERAVMYTTGATLFLTLLEQWAHPDASYSIERPAQYIGLANHVASLLVLLLFGSACVYIARQQAIHRYAQESLTDLESKLTAVVQLTPDALVLANANGYIVFWNAGAEKLFGYTEKEALGQPLTVIIPPRYREGHLQAFARICQTGESKLIGRTIELHGLRKGGKEFPLELSLATWQAKGMRFFSAFLRDLTERKRHETRQAIQLAISQVLIESQTVEQAGRQILQSVGQLAEWEVGLIWILDSRQQALRCATVWEQTTKPALGNFLQQSLVTEFSSGVGLPGRVLASGEPYWITNVVKDDNFPRLDLARAAGLHAAFGFPIKDSKGVVGVIEFFTEDIRPPDNSLLHTFSDIGIKVGQFIERRRLADESVALLRDLQEATSGWKGIRGLIAMCATCKRIRIEPDVWEDVERFIQRHAAVEFSHTICTNCARQAHPDWDTT